MNIIQVKFERVFRWMFWAGFLFCALAAATGVRAEIFPAAGAMDVFQYPKDLDLSTGAAWLPIDGGVPVTDTVMKGRNALHMVCNFRTNSVERASWEQRVKLNLQTCEGVQFKFWCPNPSPVAFFSIYFRSGSGWYHADFFPESSASWNTIIISKSAMKNEGEPAGWGQISSIRVSAWRGRTADTEFYLGDIRKMGELGDGVDVIILKSDLSARHWPDQKSSFDQTAKTTMQDLRNCDIASVTISDEEVTQTHLAQAKLVVLPQDPILSDRVVDLLTQYIRQGGKVLIFYTIPDRLRTVLNLKGGDQIKENHPGSFAQIQFVGNALPGAPAVVAQRSKNISLVRPIRGTGQVLANWLDEQGKPVGYPAVVGSSNYMVMTHVLLPGDEDSKARMLLAMVGDLVPELGKQAVASSLARIGNFAGFTNYEEAVAQISKLDNDGLRAAKFIASAAALRNAALQMAAAQKYADAIEKAAEAGKQLKAAYCAVQPLLAGEFRGFWCHNALGVPGMDWDEAVHRLADNGFTAIFPNMLSGGVAYYPSKVLPVAKVVAERGDQIRECLAACRKYGIQMHVWKLNWNLKGAPKEFIDKMRDGHRIQISSKGKEELSLCPSNPDNQRLEIDAMLELVRNYDVDGIHFDYIRYPSSDYCFCDGCKERFQHAQGVLLRSWPKDVLPGGSFHQLWLDWRRENITTVVKAVSEQARALKPNIKLSAAVFRYWDVDRDGVGQDWKLWCDKGYLNFVCPMDYTCSKAQFENMVSQQVELAGKVPCYPGLGASATSTHFGADRAIEEINIARRYKTGGFIIFNYGANEFKELLPMLGSGITRVAK